MDIKETPSTRFEILDANGMYPPQMVVEGVNREVKITLCRSTTPFVIPAEFVRPLIRILDRIVDKHNFQ